MMKRMILILVITLLALLGTSLVSPAFAFEFRVHKFDDVNRNEVQDPGEMDIEGWEIRIFIQSTEGGWVLIAMGLTGPDGTVVFSGLLGDSTYRVWEALLECWEPTTMVYGPWLDGYYNELFVPSGCYHIIEFGNAYECDGGQGCTPGYWRNIRKHGDEWAYDPYNDYFDDVDVFDCGPHLTLNETVRAKGGGLNKLLRFATAALLDAAHPEVNSGLTEGGVIDMTCDALISEDWDIFDGFFDDEICPLN